MHSIARKSSHQVPSPGCFCFSISIIALAPRSSEMHFMLPMLTLPHEYNPPNTTTFTLGLPPISLAFVHVPFYTSLQLLDAG
jgi:hypothetical protein